MRHPQPLRNFQRTPTEVKIRTLTRQPAHFQFFPRYSMLDAGSKRLRTRFLRRKTRGKAFGKAGLAPAVGNFSGGKNPVQKPFSKALNRSFDALDFHNVDPGANQHEWKFSCLHGSTVGAVMQSFYRCGTRVGQVKKIVPMSDQSYVSRAGEFVDWDLRLTATCGGDTQRAVRFLTGAVLACGGWVLSRSMPGSDSAEISFEFPRAVSVEVYTMLIAAGLDLSSDAHLRITGLCQCTRDLIATKALDAARIRLMIFPSPSSAIEEAPKEADIKRNP